LKRVLITGGAGFIGSNLADRLLADGVDVVVYDNFKTGRRPFVAAVERSPHGRIIEGDVLDRAALAAVMADREVVFHLAANADVRHGVEHPRRDLEQNTIGTSNVLEAMRSCGVRRIVFASTGAIYGEPDEYPTPETCRFPIQTSLYGASKLAGEGLVQAYAAGFGFASVILRFVSIMGERYSHGHLFDFYAKLLRDPRRIEVLGNGQQRKSYLYVADCIEAMSLVATTHLDAGAYIYNLGSEEVTDVDTSVEAVARHMALTPEVVHTGGERGWIGDSPLIHLDCEKLRGLGWRPRVTIEEAVGRTLSWFDANRWMFSRCGP
jgi:UDP-glucose 4-epimerase